MNDLAAITAPQARDLTEDDRWSASKEKVTPRLRGHLQYVIETATNVLDDLTQED